MPGLSERLAPRIVTVRSAISADGTVPGFVAPITCTVVAVYMMVQTTLAGNTTNYLTITVQDGGATGTGTASIASRGGKSTAWTAVTKYTALALTGTPVKLDGGDAVTVKYDEEGTVAVGDWMVEICVVPGTVV